MPTPITQAPKAPVMAAVRQTAPAKLNLTLKILGQRADGYHALESLVAFTPDVADLVTLTPSATCRISFSGPFADGLENSSTTVSVAHDLLVQAERRVDGVSDLKLGTVVIDKAIPLASGLGGGSADAAAFLRAVMKANPTLQDAIDWLGLAGQIGADVPVCLASQVHIMSGIGDKLIPAPDLPELAVVLIKTEDASCADKTKRVFAHLNAAPIGSGADSRRDEAITAPRFSCAEDVAAFVTKIGNDLLPPARALMPSLDSPLERVAAQPSCLAASISGAGPTVFGLFADKGRAKAAAEAIQQAEPSWWVRVSGLV